jgi:hypothetical protein
MQGGGSLQNAQYALVKAFANGTARIDGVLGEIDTGTNDVAVFDGHLYSNKAPGVAMLVTPAYAVLHAAGVAAVGDPTRMVWALGLFSGVLPALALVLLVRRAGDRFEPGFGTAAGVVLGGATLILPFAGLFLSHVLSALLVFAAFVLLLEERERPGAPRVAAAGALAGFSVAVEYPNALAVALLGAYVLARPPRLRRAVAFGAGTVLGVSPVFVYNLWAFGSLTHSSYDIAEGKAAVSFFGFPSVDSAVELFVSQQGLIVGSPVLGAAIAGVVLLARRGMAAEALLIAGVVVGFAVLSAAWYSPFGGFSPGPRFLVVALPFLCVALPPVARAAPVTTGALALVSAAAMALLTATHPLAGYDGRWVERLRDGDVPLTVTSLAGVTGWYSIVPFFGALILAGWWTLCATPAVSVRPADTPLAGAAVLLWALVAATAHDGGQGGSRVRVLLAAAAVAGALALARVALGSRRAESARR